MGGHLFVLEIMMRTLRAVPAALAITAFTLWGTAFAGDTPAPEGTRVYIISPSNGETVSGPVTVRFGLTGMGIAPAGVTKEKTGHHHLLLDTNMLEGEDLDFSIPADDNHIHFGGGQTETTLDLVPGTHTLQLLMGDQNHVPHNPPITSDVVTITVE